MTTKKQVKQYMRHTMALVKCLLLLLSVLCFSYCSADPIGQYCGGNTIQSNSTISANIDSLLSMVAQKIDEDRFIANSTGTGKSKAYVLALCKGYATSSECSGCIKNATMQIRHLCPNQSDARVWYEYCFLRYSDRDFIGKVDTSWRILLANVQNATNPNYFHNALGKLFDKLVSIASGPGGPRFSEGSTKLSLFTTLYGFAQCTPDLSELDCSLCLATAIQNFSGFCRDKKGCQVFYSSCYVRYEEYPFYNSLGINIHAKIRKAVIYP